MSNKRTVAELLALAKKAPSRVKKSQKDFETRQKELANKMAARNKKLLRPIASRIFQQLLASARANANNGILDFNVALS